MRALTGKHSFDGTYYAGPKDAGVTCTFKLYALSSRLEIRIGATREEVQSAMKGKVIDKATLSATL